MPQLTSADEVDPEVPLHQHSTIRNPARGGLPAEATGERTNGPRRTAIRLRRPHHYETDCATASDDLVGRALRRARTHRDCRSRIARSQIGRCGHGRVTADNRPNAASDRSCWHPALPHLEEPSYRRSCRPVPGETSKPVCADRLSCCARRLDCPENDQLLTVFSGCQ